MQLKTKEENILEVEKIKEYYRIRIKKIFKSGVIKINGNKETFFGNELILKDNKVKLLKRGVVVFESDKII
jgi:hypothetical protein